jgi:hypothetical protein
MSRRHLTFLVSSLFSAFSPFKARRAAEGLPDLAFPLPCGFSRSLKTPCLRCSHLLDALDDDAIVKRAELHAFLHLQTKLS